MKRATDPDGVLLAVEDAREEALQRELARHALASEGP